MAQKKSTKKNPAKETAVVEAAGDQAEDKRLLPPKGGAVVRMYRIGHGDCFLLAFDGDAGENIDAAAEPKPVYVLIDCGYKPGSPKFIGTTPKEVTASIWEATGGRAAKDGQGARNGKIDVVVVTHEHQDHVNAISEANFKGIDIGQAWFAWTEDPTNGTANDLRTIYKDKLMGLMAAHNQLALAADEKDKERAEWIEEFLAFELGGDDEGQPFDLTKARGMLGAAPKDPLQSMNKKSMQLLKDRAKDGVSYLRPHDKIHPLPGADWVRVFSLGPPENLAALKDLDPVGGEVFNGLALAVATPGNYFSAAAKAAEARTQAAKPAGAAAAPVVGAGNTAATGSVDNNSGEGTGPGSATDTGGDEDEAATIEDLDGNVYGYEAHGNCSLAPEQQGISPFARRYQVGWNDDFTAVIEGASPHQIPFFETYYGNEKSSFSQEWEEYEDTPSEPVVPPVPCNAEWRRIDNAWLDSAGQLALAMNNDTNNASLVLAFELGKGGKVLLFAADAQRGNWRSWACKPWKDGSQEITTKDLLARTVLYKVGHHCSHNATLNGQPGDDYPNLGWMGQGASAGEFTAMITAVPAWAKDPKVGWDHPQDAIKNTLMKKACGRVLQTDTDLDKMTAPQDVSPAAWNTFLARTTGDRLYFDYRFPG